MSGLRNPRIALQLAFACLVGLTITGILAYLVPIVQARDSATLQGFVALNRPALTVQITRIAHLADPGSYAVIGLLIAAMAAVRRRPRVAVAIVCLLFVTGLTTQLLKQGLAHPRFSDWLGDGQIAAASWPSGHATASMTLALCAVLAAPPRARPTVAAIGALFAISVSYAILALGWHFPSDVIGGFFVASMWTLVAVAVLARLPAPRARTAERRRPRLPVDVVHGAFGPVLVAGAAIGTVVAAWMARPEAAAFARDRPWFVLGAVGIAALAAALSAALARAART